MGLPGEPGSGDGRGPDPEKHGPATARPREEDDMRNDLLADVFRKSLLTRVFEDRFVKLAMEGAVPPLLHPGAGQEVAQIAAIAALNDDDPVLYAHRGTGYM